MTSNDNLYRFFSAADANPRALEGERVGVVGYGNLGSALALNLRDSGVEPLVVGNISDEYADQARSDGFAVLEIGEAVAASDIVLVLLPDEVIPEVFASDLGPNLRPGSAVIFASGYNLAYGLVQPPARGGRSAVGPAHGWGARPAAILEPAGLLCLRLGGAGCQW